MTYSDSEFSGQDNSKCGRSVHCMLITNTHMIAPLTTDNGRLTVYAVVIRGSVDGAVGQQLEMPVLDVHLNFSRGACDMRQICAALAANRWILH